MLVSPVVKGGIMTFWDMITRLVQLAGVLATAYIAITLVVAYFYFSFKFWEMLLK